MEKIKINMMSGSSVEKPLVTAFKGNGGTYVVLDNEINGTMGLPIILVSKLENNKLTKVVDTNEWAAVKESLRMIIAGNQVDYVTILESIGADDVFFSQLTLPVASFDTLKNNYKPNANSVGNLNVGNQENIVTDNLNTQVNQGFNDMSSPVNNMDVNSGMNVSQNPIDLGINNSSPVNALSNQSTNIGEVAPVMPSMPESVQTEAQVVPNIPNVEPISENVNTVEVPVDFTADKEAFLKACENMFDALVAKFKK